MLVEKIGASLPHAMLGALLGRRPGAATRRPALDEMAASHKPWLTPALEAALASRVGAFVDVGAHVGQTLSKIHRLDRMRRYVGFEPRPACAQRVQGLIDHVGAERWSIMPVGLAEESGLRRLRSADAGCDEPIACMVEGFRPDASYRIEQDAPVIRGDDALASAGIDRVAALKIDVEGAELEVLTGLRGAVRRDRPVIFFRVLGDVLLRSGAVLDAECRALRARRAARLNELLRSLDYTVFAVRDGGRRLIEIEAAEPTLSGDPSDTDFVAASGSVADDLCARFEGRVDRLVTAPARALEIA